MRATVDGRVAALPPGWLVRQPRGWIWLVLPALPVLLLTDAALGPGPAGWRDVVQSFLYDDTIGQAIAWEARVPRSLAALTVGAALGVAGCLMQAITRNPLASPDILAVTQGAHLALVVAILAMPWSPPLAATLLGGIAAGAVSVAVAGGPGAPPAQLALSGLAVGLACGSAAHAAVLLADNRATGLVLWATGALNQAGWARLTAQVPAIVAAAGLSMAVARGLDVMGLGRDQARSLGQGRFAVPVLAAGSGVLLAASAVVVAGPIGFVGLAAPNLVRLFGIRRHVWLLPAAAAWGGALLLLADILAQVVSLQAGAVPVGVVAACLGAPALIVAARLSPDTRVAARLPTLPGRPKISVTWVGLAFAAVICLAAGGLAGEADTPWMLAFSLRAPRIAAAGLAGAALALAGVLLQAASRNPLAGPETLGLTQGAALASVLAVLAGHVPGGAVFAAATLAGAFAGLAILIAAAGTAPAARLTLVGLATASGLSAAGVLAVVAARLQVTQALAWLAGTTHGRDWRELLPLVLGLGLAAPPLFAVSRRLDVLALGQDAAAGLGESVTVLRAWLLAGAAVLTAAAVSVVGAVGFVGLLAPHAARLLAGPRHGRLLPLAAALGAVLTVAADALGRAVIAPREIPLGLVTALLGAPLFLLLLGRR